MFAHVPTRTDTNHRKIILFFLISDSRKKRNNNEILFKFLFVFLSFVHVLISRILFFSSKHLNMCNTSYTKNRNGYFCNTFCNANREIKIEKKNHRDFVSDGLSSSDLFN